MARDFSARTDIDNTDPTNYPDGRWLDSSPASANNGTVIEESLLGDIQQLSLKLLREAGITPNGNPDTDSVNQLLSALQTLYTYSDPDPILPALRKKIIEIGNWDMNTTASVAVNHSITNATASIRRCEVVIRANPDLAINAEYLTNNAAGSFEYNANQVVLSRDSNSLFALGALWSGTAFNRGWVTIHYTES